jgi:hypothetical protein
MFVFRPGESVHQNFSHGSSPLPATAPQQNAHEAPQRLTQVRSNEVSATAASVGAIASATSRGHWDNAVAANEASHHVVGLSHPAAPDLPLPARYLSGDEGPLRPDSRHPGLWLDAAGQQHYLLRDGNRYAVSHDGANQTWRVVQVDEPGTPGIPVKLDRNGAWKVHAELGGRGGGWESELDRAQAVATLDAKRTETQAKRASVAKARDTRDRAELRFSEVARERVECSRAIDDAQATILGYSTRAAHARSELTGARYQEDGAIRAFEAAHQKLLDARKASQAASAQMEQADLQLRTAVRNIKAAGVKLENAERHAHEWQKKREAKARELSATIADSENAWRERALGNANLTGLQHELAELETEQTRLEQRVEEIDRGQSKSVLQ